MAKAPKNRTALASAICDDLIDGLSLRQACAKEGRPDKATYLRWLAEDADLRDQYARARERQAEHLADEILEIADDGTNDWMVRNHGEDDETMVPNHEHISRSKLRVDARKWIMSKLAPKKYGDKVQVGGDPDGAPVQHVHVIERRIVRPTDPDR